LLGVALIAVAVYVANFGLWPRFFDIEWDEEVLLHDGRITMVHVSRTYERQGKRLDRLGGIQRRTTFSFDAGPQIGIIGQALDGGEVFFIDNKNGVWYVGLWGENGTPTIDVSIDPLSTHLYIVAVDGKLRRISNWSEFPFVLARQNIMPPTPNSREIARFDKSVLSIKEKVDHWTTFPRGAGDPFPLIKVSIIQQGN
jgi:hypothetical protein